MQHIIRFVKMHALGNDFAIIDRLTQSFYIDQQAVRSLGHRRTGIGFDQLLVLEPPLDPDHDFSYKIYNNNGTHAKQCLNGLRALAHYVHDQGLLKKNQISFVTDEKKLTCEVLSHSVTKITLQMPLDAHYMERLTLNEDLVVDLVFVGSNHLISWGTPRDQRAAVIQKLKNEGYSLELCSISFALFDQYSIQIETYDKGIGKTLSCGSAAIAAVLAHRQNHPTAKLNIRVNTQIGYVTVIICDQGVSLIGPVTRAFRGEFSLRYQ